MRGARQWSPIQLILFDFAQETYGGDKSGDLDGQMNGRHLLIHKVGIF